MERDKGISSGHSAGIENNFLAKEKLSDEQMGNLLSAVGNHEAKAITLILMRDGNLYSRGDLYKRILDAQGESKGWEMGRPVPFSYCSSIFAPTGLVEERIINASLSSYGYAITKEGKELGIPLAGLMLDFSERHDLSLSKLLGITNSPSERKIIFTKEGKNIEFRKRAPAATLKIFYEILTSPSLPIRDIDIVRRIGEEDSVIINRNLIRLSESGLIKRKAIEINKQYSAYKISINPPKGELPVFKTSPSLTKSVFNILKEHPNHYLTIKDVYKFFIQKQNEKREKKLPSTLSAILSFLHGHNYVVVENFSNEKHSEINLTEEQKLVLTEFTEIIFRFQNQDRKIIERGKSSAGEIVANPEKLTNLLRRAKEASSNAKQSPIEETQTEIETIIYSCPGITNREIQRILGERYGKKLTTRSTSILSFFLQKRGSIRIEKEGSLNKYYPNK